MIVLNTRTTVEIYLSILDKRKVCILAWLAMGDKYIGNKRIHTDTAIYFLTFSVVEWLPLFVSEEPCLIIIDGLNYYHRQKNLRVNAFVIMPTHR